MARISRRKLSNEVLIKIYDLFFEVIGKKSSIGEFKSAVSGLLSPVEQIMIAKRVAIVFLLLRDIDQRTISNVVKVSNATASRYSRLIENNEEFKNAFNKILSDARLTDFIYELFNVLLPPGRYGVNWKAAWQRKGELQRRKEQGF